MQRALESSPFTLLAKPCPPKRFVETVRRICYENQPHAGYQQRLANKLASRTSARPETSDPDQTSAVCAKDNQEGAAENKALGVSDHSPSIRAA
jgi:hypothetical protein